VPSRLNDFSIRSEREIFDSKITTMTAGVLHRIPKGNKVFDTLCSLSQKFSFGIGVTKCFRCKINKRLLGRIRQLR